MMRGLHSYDIRYDYPQRAERQIVCRDSVSSEAVSNTEVEYFDLRTARPKNFTAGFGQTSFGRRTFMRGEILSNNCRSLVDLCVIRCGVNFPCISQRGTFPRLVKCIIYTKACS
jgi:hypothetical protein